MLALQVSLAVGLAGGLLLVVVGLGVLHFFTRRSIRRLRGMVGTNTVDAGGVEPGRVEIEGTVADAGHTVSPELRGNRDTDAVITEFRERRKRDDPNDQDPVEDFTLPIPQQLAPNVANSRVAVPFYVEDDTGRVLVDGGNADSSLDADAKQRRNVGMEGYHKKVEAVLAPGDDVYVLGEAVPAEEYEDRVAEREIAGGVLGTLLSLVVGDATTPASAAIDEEDDLVVTRTAEDDVFVVSDTAEWRNWLRQIAATAFWTILGLGLVGGGAALVYLGLS